MTYSISKEFALSAAHYLRGLSPTHPCARLHGHNYTIRLEIVTNDVDEVGFVFDYNKLDGFKTALDTMLDHRCLNDVLNVNPTAENIAKWLWDRAKVALDEEIREEHENYELVIYVSETPKTWATYAGVS